VLAMNKTYKLKRRKQQYEAENSTQ
jgi:hypothetical protein